MAGLIQCPTCKKQVRERDFPFHLNRHKRVAPVVIVVCSKCRRHHDIPYQRKMKHEKRERYIDEYLRSAGWAYRTFTPPRGGGSMARGRGSYQVCPDCAAKLDK